VTALANEPKWMMVIDTRRCIGCQGCSVACKMENAIPPGVFRTHVKYLETGKYPKVKRHFLNAICMHCEKPPCVPVCPTDATFKREDGLVLVDYDKCIGCGYCVNACPYDARYIAPSDIGDIRAGKADKCTFCAHRIDAGLEPACVQTCVGHARIFGDANDPESEVAQLKTEALDHMTKSTAATYGSGDILDKGLSVFYILPDPIKEYNLPDPLEYPESIPIQESDVKPISAGLAAVAAGVIAVGFVANQFDKGGKDESHQEKQPKER
jgi:Fe-S-cluster-containing dehydrogenase component